MSTKDSIPQTPEAIAYQLMRQILELENKPLTFDRSSLDDLYPSRDDILDTYKRCLLAVKNGV